MTKRIASIFMSTVLIIAICFFSSPSKNIIALAETMREQDSAKSKVMLTFDDGPSENTRKILKILDKHDIKASFFVVKNPYQKELYKKIIDEGHLLCAHSASHIYQKIYESDTAFFADLRELEDYVFSLTGKRLKCVRLPGGTRNTYASPETMERILATLKDKGYKVFDWNVHCEDGRFVNMPVSEIVSKTVDGSKKGRNNIILLHDAPANKNTAEAVEEIIIRLKEKGFVFDTLENADPVIFMRK